jgi:uncharacterized HAD superfamily protein
MMKRHTLKICDGQTTKLFGLDIDAVLFDTGTRAVEFVKEQFGVQINISQMTKWKIQDCTDVTEEQARSMWDSAIFYWKALPLLGSVDFTIELNKYYCNALVTSRSEKVFEVTSQRLRDYGYAFDYLEFNYRKSEVAQKYNIEYFVEDKYATALKLAKVCEMVFLLDYPWNQGSTPVNVIRINTDWQEGVIQPDYGRILEFVT